MWFRPWRHELDAQAIEVVGACLKAAADGPFFQDDEFSTIFGFNRAEVSDFSNSWPASVDEHSEFLAVNSAVNNLLGYPHRQDAEWSTWIPIERDALRTLFERIREAAGANDHTRRLLATQLSSLAALSDEQIATRRTHITDVIRSATRLGLDVPERLVPK